MNHDLHSRAPQLAATFGADDLARWQASQPGTFPTAESVSADDLRRDGAAASAYFALGQALLDRLPSRAQRSETEQAAADAVHGELRAVRLAFLRSYVGAIYAQLTDDCGRFVQPEALVYTVAERFPGLAPTRQAVEADHGRWLAEKEQIERDQALVLWQMLAQPRAGAHLTHAMLQPRPESLERLEDFRRTGVADFGVISLKREGRAGHLTLSNREFLNAEDANTLPAFETCIDLALLDPQIEVGVLRGGVIEHPRYRGRRIFSAGLNLTHLYEGKIPFLFFVRRDVGMINKLYRGLTGPDWYPLEPEDTLEKPWIAAVEGFAIGGGCQLLLVVDQVLAEEGAYFSLPARKEGIIPGTANLRLPRVVGDRLARQGIQFDRQFPVDSPEGALLCDAIVPRGEMDTAVAEAIAGMTDSGVVSLAANRKALRVGQEPREVFRQYAATFVKELADCHFSPTLVRNLERFWR
jgi:(3,5-dihydroxyphenyl)acetyl-CoA 1,2-dioxygenase